MPTLQYEAQTISLFGIPNKEINSYGIFSFSFKILQYFRQNYTLKLYTVKKKKVPMSPTRFKNLIFTFAFILE